MAACLAAVVAALALVAGAIGEQRRPAPALPAVTGPAGARVLDGPWIVRGDHAGRGDGAGLARRPLRRAHGDDAVLAQRAPRARRRRASARSPARWRWYRTTVIVPRAGVYAIRFESVNHQAAVWVDGRFAARHTGTYLPFEARVRLTGGAHTLVVRADWRDPAAMKADAWHRTWFNFGGINRPVSIRALGASELDSPSIVTHLDGTDRGGRPRGRRQQPRRPADHRRARDARRHRGALRPRPARSRRSAPPSARACASRAPNLWEPGHPTLEALRLEVPGEAAFTARVGLREVRWAGGRLELNGEALKLRGASLQEDAPGRGDALTDADADAIVARLKAIGANATRSQHPLSDALLDRLDAAGILVWQGVGPVDAPGAWTSRTPVQQRRAIRRVRLNVLQERLHPSVVAWNLANEVAGNGHYGGQPEYVDAAAQLVHRLDPGPPDRGRRLGHAHARPAPASCTATSTPSAPRTTRAGTTTRSRPPATVQAAIDAWLARAARDLPGQGADRQRVRRRGQPAQRARHPGLGELPVAACSPATSAPTRRPRGSTASSSGTSRTSRSRRRSRAAPSAARCRASTSCAGSTRRACSPTTGSPSRRSLRCAGRSRAERRSSVVRVRLGAARRLLPHRGKEVAVGAALAAPHASAVPGAEALRTSSAFRNTLRRAARSNVGLPHSRRGRTDARPGHLQRLLRNTRDCTPRRTRLRTTTRAANRPPASASPR